MFTSEPVAKLNGYLKKIDRILPNAKYERSCFHFAIYWLSRAANGAKCLANRDAMHSSRRPTMQRYSGATLLTLSPPPVLGYEGR